MIKIFEIKLDVNHFQSFLPENKAVWYTKMLEFNCHEKSSTWDPPNVFVPETRLLRGNFFSLCPGAFVLDEYGKNQLLRLIERSGELLPLYYNDEEYSVVNVLHCFNMLDEKNTQWVVNKETGAKILLKKPVFRRDRLFDEPLFKIPEICKSTILTIEGMKDPEDEFKPMVEQACLTGLVFQEIWNEEM